MVFSEACGINIFTNLKEGWCHISENKYFIDKVVTVLQLQFKLRTVPRVTGVQNGTEKQQVGRYHFVIIRVNLLV